MLNAMLCGRVHRLARFARRSAIAIGVGALLIGCGSDPKAQPTSQPASIRDRQDQALKDPMNYKVEVGKQRDKKNESIWSIDRDGLKRDFDHVFNP
jgi:hypothetical protein